MARIDVCIICALAEEATAFQNVLEKQGAVFQMKHSQQQQRDYLYTTIPNNRGDTLSLILTWQVRTGMQDTASSIEKVLQEFEPRFLAMTGFCGGNKSQVKLGDLIVADKTFIYDSGSVTESKGGKKEYQYSMITFQMHNDVLHSLRMFTNWTSAAETLKQERPISKRQQRDWLLDQLLKRQTTIYDLPDEELATYAPHWREIRDQLLQEKPPLLDTETLALRDPEGFRRMTKRSSDNFPYKDAENPACYIGSLASGNAVRKDNPFPELEKVDRKILGLDMEGTAIYHALQERPSIRFLVAKGVSDYADGDKDYHYHGYAASLSAAYVSTFISYFVNDEYMPWPDKPQIPTNNPSTPAASQSISQPSQNPKTFQETQTAITIKKPTPLFISYSKSRKDEELLEDFSSHIALMSRGPKRLIEEWDRRYIKIGDDEQETIQRKINEAEIFLLILTPNYYTSEFYNEEIEQIRLRHQQGAKVIGLLFRPTSNSWKQTFFGNSRSLPRNDIPVTSWSNRDEALAEIAEEIRMFVENLQKS
jgi:nucleoside phosphorylase